jgi:hypothetical protein
MGEREIAIAYAEEIYAGAEQKCNAILADTKEKCDAMIDEAGKVAKKIADEEFEKRTNPLVAIYIGSVLLAFVFGVLVGKLWHS